ncbi:MAG TPA: energy transducer TonB [Pyrinomonadaceae bacterium]|nr:energy transducer TonB [Pyrinomonadaceae bacterium]
MKLISVLMRAIAFLTALIIGVTAGGLAGNVSETSDLDDAVVPVPYYTDSGVRSCWTSKPGVSSTTSTLSIESKPTPSYTDEARAEQTEGTVVLRVTFLASGKIGAIEPIKTLPNGLTEQAVAAAQRIEFKPAIQHGRPISVSKQVEYTFSIY